MLKCTTYTTYRTAIKGFNDDLKILKYKNKQFLNFAFCPEYSFLRYNAKRVTSEGN